MEDEGGGATWGRAPFFVVVSPDLVAALDRLCGR